MGLREIGAAYDAALGEHDRTIGTFVEQATQINAKLAGYKAKLEEIQKAVTRMSQDYMAAKDQVVNLNSHGIVQLEEMKKLLILATQHPRPHAVKLEEIESLAQECAAQIDESTRARVSSLIKKRVGAWPDKLAVGMVFQNIRSRSIIELMALNNGDKHKVKEADPKNYALIAERAVAARDLKPANYFFIRT